MCTVCLFWCISPLENQFHVWYEVKPRKRKQNVISHVLWQVSNLLVFSNKLARRCWCCHQWTLVKNGFRTAATSKMERFVIIVNRFILDVAAVLDPSLYFSSDIFSASFNFMPFQEVEKMKKLNHEMLLILNISFKSLRGRSVN